MKRLLLAVLLVGACASIMSAASGLERADKVRRAANAGLFEIPFLLNPSSNDVERMTIVDANGDGVKWKYDAKDNGSLAYAYHSNNSADDWVFIPVNAVEGNSAYILEFRYRTAGNYDESFKVCYGASPTVSAMTHELWKRENFRDTKYATQKIQFTATKSELGYIGIKAYSAKDQYGIYLKDIGLSVVNTSLPLPVTIMSSVIDGLTYSATVTMPTKTVTGGDIEGNVGLEMRVDGEVRRTEASCQPGAVIDITDTFTKGTHHIEYRAFVTVDGERHYSDGVGETVKAVSTDAYGLPFEFAIDAAQFVDECNVTDANHDGVSWEWSNDKQTAFYYYNDNADADDWLMLPVVDFGASGGTFNVCISAAVASYNFPESFEVCIGESSELSQMRPVMVCEDITNTSFQPYTTKMTLEGGGRRYIAVHATSKRGMYSLYVRDLSVTKAADMTPNAPELRSVSMNGLDGVFSIGMPTASVDGQPLNDEMNLVVKVDGNLYTTTTTTAGAELEVPVTFTLGRHTVTFAAEMGSGTDVLRGAETLYSLVAKHPEGYAYELPLEMLPTQGEFDTFTILDNNNDGDTWQYFSGTNAAMECKTTGENVSDDWVFLPPFRVGDVSRIYAVSVQARAYLESYPESFDVCIGPSATPEGMEPVISRTGMTKYLYDDSLTGDWIAPAVGTYVVGIHRRSDGSAHTLRVRNIKVCDSGRSVNAPAAAVNIEGNGDSTGQLKATVDFDMPTYSVGGQPLATDYVVTARLTSTTGASVETTGCPGERKSLTVTAAEGYSQLKLSTFSATDGKGQTVEVPVYCGLDIPSLPEVYVSESEDNMTLTVTWSDSVRGENGGSVNMSELRHGIYEPIGGGLYWNLVAEIPSGVDSYTFDTEVLQNVTYIGVTAINDRGESQVGVNYAITGAPYAMPMNDDFMDGVFDYEPVVIDAPDETYVSEWYLDYPSLLMEPLLSEKDGQALICMRADETCGTRGLVRLPKFTTRDAHGAKIEITYFDGAFAPAATIGLQAYGCEQVEIGHITPSDTYGWRTVVFDLPASSYNKGWANLVIEPNFDKAPQIFVMRGYKVHNVYANDLDIAVYGPEQPEVGHPASVTVKVHNMGENAVDMPVVDCRISHDNYTEILTADCADVSIAGGETKVLSYTFTPTVEMLGRCKATAAFVDYTDEVADNNMDTDLFSVVPGSALLVTDLAAEPNESGLVRLHWSEAEAYDTDAVAVAYNVYRNGAKVGTAQGVTEYVDAAGRKNDCYHVAAVTAAGEEHPLSNKVVIDFLGGVNELNHSGVSVIPGGVRVTGCAGQTICVYTPDGLTQVNIANPSDNETIALAAGVYVIVVGNNVYKLTIK